MAVLMIVLMPLIIMVAATPIGVTVLGWVAVSQIRRSGGKLCGMGLAVFDGLLFPLLALDALIAVAFKLLGVAVIRAMHLHGSVRLSILLVLMVACIIVVDWLIVRVVWRAVNRPAEGVPMPQASSGRPKLRLFLFFFLVFAIALTAVLVWAWQPRLYSVEAANSADGKLRAYAQVWSNTSPFADKNERGFYQLNVQTIEVNRRLSTHRVSIPWSRIASVLQKSGYELALRDANLKERDIKWSADGSRVSFSVDGIALGEFDVRNWYWADDSLGGPAGTLSEKEIVRLESLADSPFKLRKLSTAEVIKAGLAKPTKPWAWQELEGRPLTVAEGGQIVDGLTDWLHRDYPRGYPEPLHWFGNFLDKLAARGLVSDEQAVRFAEALHGDVRCAPVFRRKEGVQMLDVRGDWRSVWMHTMFGLTMMNELHEVRLDDKPLELAKNFHRNWNSDSFEARVELPPLTPGKYKLKFETITALVPASDVGGLESTAAAADWPPAKRRWTRFAETELVIYPAKAEIVSRTEDPQLDPLASGGLSVKQVSVYSRGGKPQATIEFALTESLPVPVSFDVALRAGGQTVPCGALWAAKRADGQPLPRSGDQFRADFASLAPSIKEADIILTPNTEYVENEATIDRIWGREIVFSNVPVKRLDLGEASPEERKPAASVETVTPAVPDAQPTTRVAVGLAILPVLALFVGLPLLVIAGIVVAILLIYRKSKSSGGKTAAIILGILALVGILVLLAAVAGLFFFGVKVAS
jgi:hypothetical protein